MCLFGGCGVKLTAQPVMLDPDLCNSLKEIYHCLVLLVTWPAQETCIFRTQIVKSRFRMLSLVTNFVQASQAERLEFTETGSPQDVLQTLVPLISDKLPELLEEEGM